MAHDGRAGDEPANDAGFAARLSNLLREQRRHTGVTRRELARGSRFRARDLRRAERGSPDLAVAAELAVLYGVDLAAILPGRTPVEVDPEGRVSTAGAVEEFDPDDPDGVLVAYLHLIRRLRRAEHERVVGLRRDDVVVLADVLASSGDDVVDRLGALMGVTRAQRKAMVGLFVGGAVVVGLAVTAVAATTNESVSEPAAPSAPAAPRPVEPPAPDATSPEETTPDEPVEPEPVEPEPVEPEPVEIVTDAEPWGLPVGPPAGLDVSPIAPDPAPAPGPTPAPTPAPAPDPAPAPAPDPAPADPGDDVAVGPPPVPTTEPPLPAPPPEPAPAEPAPPEPAGDAPGTGVDPDGNEVGVGPPPVPTTAAPIP